MWSKFRMFTKERLNLGLVGPSKTRNFKRPRFTRFKKVTIISTPG